MWIPENTSDEKSLFQVIGAIRKQANTWTNVDLNLCGHMTSQGYNALLRHMLLQVM